MPWRSDSELVGREDDLAIISRLLADAQAGAGGVVVVRGEPGIGKSVLLEFARERAEEMRATCPSSR